MARTKMAPGRADRISKYMARRKSVRTYVPRNVPTARIPGSLVSTRSVYPFKRTCSLRATMNPSTGFTIGAASGFGLSFSFQLAACIVGIAGTSGTATVPNYGEFTSLFDQWRIHHVDVKLVYSNNTSTTASGTTFLPLVYIAPDLDNASPPGAVTDVQQRSDHKLWQLGTNGTTSNIRTLRVYPTATGTAYQGVTAGYAALGRKTWCDCAYPNITYYGAGMFWDADRSTNQDVGNLDMIFDVYFEFRGVI